MVVLLNRGTRTWSLKPGVGKDGKPVKRRLPPGGSVEALDQAEADQLLAHKREIVDAESIVPQVTEKVADLKAQVATLTAEIATLKQRLAIHEGTQAEESPSKKGGGKK